MRKTLFTLTLAALTFAACNQHKKVTFVNQYGLTLAANLYDGGFTEPAGHGESKNLIPWDTLAEFFYLNLK